MSEANRCPVCQARFRGASTCSRCGADLGRMMRLTAQAWQLRQAARTAFASGEFQKCTELAVKAQEIRATSAGQALQTLASWLGRQSST